MQLHSYAETLNVKISADVSKIKESTLRDITFTFNVLSENVITFVIMWLFLKKKILFKENVSLFKSETKRICNYAEIFLAADVCYVL